MRASHVVIILLTIWFLFIGAAGWATYVVLVRPGMIEVSVSERDWDRKRSFRVYVPAGLANGAIRMTGLLDDMWRVSVLLDDGPLDVEWHGDRDVAELFAILAEELESEENLRILDVRDGDDRVTIDLRDGALAIEVESWRESVRVTLPPSTLRIALKVSQDLAY